MRFGLVVFLTVTLGHSSPLGQRQFRDERFAPVIEVNVSNVLIPVNVTGQDGSQVFGLKPSDFSIFENKIEQKVVSLTREEVSISLSILLDVSDSMKPDRMPSKLWYGEVASGGLRTFKNAKITVALNVVDEVLADIDYFNHLKRDDPLRKDDIISFTTFAKDIVYSVDFGADIGRLKASLQHSIEVGTSTKLREGIKFAIADMKRHLREGGKLPTRRVLLIISDGVEVLPFWYSDSALFRDIAETGLNIYAIGPIERDGLFDKMAEETGGKVYIVKNVHEVPDVVSRLLQDMHGQYLLGFESTFPPDGEWHKIRIRLPGYPDYQVSHKSGYYAEPR